MNKKDVISSKKYEPFFLKRLSVVLNHLSERSDIMELFFDSDSYDLFKKDVKAFSDVVNLLNSSTVTNLVSALTDKA